jgi:hypothetical protein
LGRNRRMEEVREQKRLEILDAYLWKQIKNDDDDTILTTNINERIDFIMRKI